MYETWVEKKKKEQGKKGAPSQGALRHTKRDEGGEGQRLAKKSAPGD